MTEKQSTIVLTGSGKQLTILSFLNQGQANFWQFFDFVTGVQTTAKQFCDSYRQKWPKYDNKMTKKQFTSC